MSLLLEALKQAEREQRERKTAAGEAPGPVTPELEPEPEQDADRESVCDFDLLEMEAVDSVPEPATESEAVSVPPSESESEPAPEEMPAGEGCAEADTMVGTSGEQTAGREPLQEFPPPLFDDVTEVLDSALGMDETVEGDEQPAETSDLTATPDGVQRADVDTTLPPATAAHLLDRTLQQEQASRRLMAGVAVLVLIGGVIGYRFLPTARWVQEENTASTEVSETIGVELPGAEAMVDSPDLPPIRPVRISGPAMDGVSEESAATGIDDEAVTPRNADIMAAAPSSDRMGSSDASIVSALPDVSEQGAAADDVSTLQVRVRTLKTASWRRRLAEAYRLLRKGEVHHARDLYLALRREHPDEPEVLLGLASAELALKHVGEARALYRRILSQDPDNTFARAGLALTQGRTDSLTERVDSPAVLAALATAAAQRGDWRRAQALFFRAHASDPENTEYLYGLAVSLDHLGKAAQALDHYRRVLERPGTNVDPEQVRRRIAWLERVVREGEG